MPERLGHLFILGEVELREPCRSMGRILTVGAQIDHLVNLRYGNLQFRLQWTNCETIGKPAFGALHHICEEAA
jgi:hypothetical protein